MPAIVRAAGWLAAALPLVAAGCGANPTTVSGTVTFQGRPVPGGSVILYCEDKQIVRGLIGPDGHYSIPNVPRGAVTVAVQAHPRVPDGMQMKQNLPPAAGGPLPPSAGLADGGKAVAIPQRYGLPEESGLSAVVGRDAVRYDIDLRP